MAREFKYYQQDFPPLEVKVKHMDLFFDVFDDHTKVTNDLKFEAKKDLSKIELDAKHLEIVSVTCANAITWKYEKEDFKLIISFKKKVKKGETVIVHTESICKPTKNDLEGLYYDETLAGNPPQMITQCQQWGFQKIAPCFDDMTAKSTYRVKINANSKYTNIITNGDLVYRKNISVGRDEVVYDNTKTPMAPYLFFLGVGNWTSFAREFEYPNGKKFILELLCLPNSDKASAEIALDIISYSVQWIYLMLGEARLVDVEKRKKILALCEKRDELKKTGKEIEVEKLRMDIAVLHTGMVCGYEYTGTVYREIAMQNSNFGGMENVGNTTIVANRLLPTTDSSDSVFAYLMAVKMHEFYHNINGSEVTGWSPFELWLNEALTCWAEHEFTGYVSGKEYDTLSTVLQIVGPGGTFDEDTGTMGMPIVPKGFNSPDELISGITYSKAPQFVKMVERVVGKEKFSYALAVYHKKFSHSNATTDDWINIMEKSTGVKLKKMADAWLTQTGYPEVKVEKKIDSKKKKCTLKFTQTVPTKTQWTFPLSFAVFGKNGKKIHESTIIIKDKKTKAEISLNEEPAFFSFSRGFSFYGKVNDSPKKEELFLQAKMDDDIVARYVAFAKIADEEKMLLIDGKIKAPRKEFVDLCFSIIGDEKTTRSVGSLLLSITEGVEDKYKTHLYEDLYQAKKKIRLAIAQKYENELLEIYKKRSNLTISAPFVEKKFFDIKNRQVKNTALAILSELDTPNIRALIINQFVKPASRSDKLVAFSSYLNGSAKDKDAIISEFERDCAGSLVKWEQFLSLIGSCENDNVLELINRVKSGKKFRIEQSNDQRALLMRFVFNRRKSLLTKDGREFLKNTLIELSKINEYNTLAMLSVFEKLDFMPKKELPKLVDIIVSTLKAVDAKKYPMITNNIKRMLKKSPVAVKLYEKEFGSIKKLLA